MQLQHGKAEEVSYTSLDAPPLDFSFKNIRNLEELKTAVPRKGQRKIIPNQEQKIKNKQEDEVIEEQKNINKQKDNDAKSDKKKVEVTRLLPQNNINAVVSTMVTASNLKNISNKAKEELEKKKAKVVQIKLVCCSLMLSYNKIRQLTNLGTVLNFVMDDYRNLQWIDLSHNYLEHIKYEFQQLPHLKTIYLHCNFIYDLNELNNLNKLSELRNFTIHGNPLASIPNFRIYVISILRNLKKLDSVLISKKQLDNAVFLSSQVKKMPLPKNIQKAPDERTEEEEDKDAS